MLDVKSTDKGMLIPRMDGSHRTGISSPATGLLVYQTDAASGFYYYNGTEWMYFGTGEDGGGHMIDADGNSYPTVKIGNQEWMAENLKVTHYRNGEAIPNETNNTSWIGLTTGAYCWYNNNATNTSGFSGLPGGCRRSDDGRFANTPYTGFFGSTTEYSSSGAWYRYLYYLYDQVTRYPDGKAYGFSIRCLKD